MADLSETLKTWSTYIASITDWQTLVQGVESRENACGIIYDLPNPLNRPDESFTIIDTRWIDVSEPHYHTNGETEIYFVLQGTGLCIVGSEIRELQDGSSVVIPPDTIHCLKSTEDLVIAAVNTPPFNQANYVPLGSQEALSLKMLLQLR